MSERSIIICVVIALLAVAFFFPYESSDDEYYRTHGKKQTAQKVIENDTLHHNDGKGIGDSREITDDLPTEAKAVSIEGAESGPRSGDEREALVPDFAPLISQINIAKEQVARKQGGFQPGTRIQGKYVQMISDSATQPSAPGAPPPAYISFHLDGSFEQHAALNINSSNGAAPQNVIDVSGHYYLKGYVLTLDQLAPDFKPNVQCSFSICPLGGQNDRGAPKRLYIEGNVFRFQQE